ncbi:MAG TPA: phospholipase D-like domain-containing protein, partial [Thermodesulfobacteriota bacterium]|nr:phospholipase D-like domain-containing protein [Thermodesulfobacteriota bacterium]
MPDIPVPSAFIFPPRPAPPHPRCAGDFRVSFSLAVLLLCCVFGFGACASLPKADEAAAPSGRPTVVGPKGELSDKRSQALFEGLNLEPDVRKNLERQAAMMESLTGVPLAAGNKVALLVNGPDTYAAMLEAIGNARDHVNLETFIFEADDTGKNFADLLIRKQMEGVQVNVLYDSVGCKSTPSSFFQRMRDAGIRAVEFNPINPVKARKSWMLAERDHRKILIVDGKVAFSGGVNISGVYSKSPSTGSGGSRSGESSGASGGRESALSGSSKDAVGGYFTRSEAPWRDTHMRVEGPAVAEFQRLFLLNWVRQGGPELPDRQYFPEVKREGADLVHVLGSDPGNKFAAAYLMYVTAIANGEKT